MKIDLSHIEETEVAFDERFELPPERLDSSQVAASVEARLRGSVRPRDGEFVVEGVLTAAGELVCSRCLEGVPWHVEEGFSMVLRAATEMPKGDEIGLGEEDLDVVFVTEDVLDLSEVAAEQVLLSLPMRVLCRQSCAGLCPRCGGNRNRADGCRCEPEIDPRWAGLRDLEGRQS